MELPTAPSTPAVRAASKDKGIRGGIGGLRYTRVGFRGCLPTDVVGPMWPTAGQAEYRWGHPLRQA